METIGKQTRLPREVWIAALTQEGIAGETLEEVVARAVEKMERIAPYRPDIFCLPEAFHVAGLTGAEPGVPAAADTPPGRLSRPLAEFARRHHCYVICPVYTRDGDQFFNAAILFDRSGQVAGVYHKIHLTEDEIAAGLSPGALDPPVFETDFGTIGVQICFDIEWTDGWQKLGEKGAQIVFWPSAYAGGKMVNAKAWQNRYCVVSSTRKDTTKICDLTGEEVAWSGRWQSWGVCAPLNLEKVLLHTWPYCEHFSALEARYGRRIRIHTLHEEELTLIESRDPELRVAQVMAQFGFKTHREHIRSAQEAQERHRKERACHRSPRSPTFLA